jgi:glycosyltransferase involved in cell wall biosynthesis
MIKLSILIPVYNVSKYLKRCLDSVYSQIDESCEVIIVDDGSTDDSGKICDLYYEKYPSLTKVFHKKNEGAYSTRNYAFNKSKGKYLWFIDPDDYIQDGAVKTIINLINNSNPDVVSLSFKRFDGVNYGKLENVFVLSEVVSGEDYLLKGKFDPYLWSKIYRNEFLKENNVLFDNRLYTQGDWLFNMYVFTTKTVSVLLTDVYAYNYFNTNPTSTLHNKNKKNHIRGVENSMLATDLFLSLMDKNYNNRIYPALVNWNNYNLSGFFYSLILIDYPISKITKIIKEYKELNLYPLRKTNNRKANVFISFVNITFLYLLSCRISHFIKYRHTV